MATQKVTPAYWDIRGLAEPIRTLFEYLEIPYEMKLYKTGESWLQKRMINQWLFQTFLTLWMERKQ